MAKTTTKPAEKKKEGFRLRRLDAVGGELVLPTMEDVNRLLRVEEQSGMKNYELIEDGETESGDDSGALEGAQE